MKIENMFKYQLDWLVPWDTLKALFHEVFVWFLCFEPKKALI